MTYSPDAALGLTGGDAENVTEYSMKTLIWKELREQRFIPIAFGVLVIAVIGAWHSVSQWMSFHEGTASLTAADTAWVLYGAWCLAGLLAAAGAIAPEIGKGTLEFLTTLPTGRPRIWRAKVAAGSIVTVLSIVAICLGHFVSVLTLFGWNDVYATFLHSKSPDSIQITVWMIFFAAYGYAVCLLISNFVDRSIAAAVLGLVTAVGVYGVLGWWMSDLAIRGSSEYGGFELASGILVALTATFLRASYTSFCLRTIRRTREHALRAGLTVLGGMAVTCVLMFLCSIVINRVADAQQKRDDAVAALTTARLTGVHLSYATRYWCDEDVTISFPAEARSIKLGFLLGQMQPFRGFTGVMTPMMKSIKSSSKSGIPASTRDSDAYVHSYVYPGTMAVFLDVDRPIISGHRSTVEALDRNGVVVARIGVDSVTQ